MYGSVPTSCSFLSSSFIAPSMGVIKSGALHLLFTLPPISFFIPWAVCSVIHSFIHSLTRYIHELLC